MVTDLTISRAQRIEEKKQQLFGSAQSPSPDRAARIAAKKAQLGFKESTAPPELSQPVTPGHILKSALSQAGELIAAPFHLVKAGVMKARSMSADDWLDLVRRPDQVADAAWSGIKGILSAIAGPDSDYARYGLRVLADRPLTPLIDALTLISLGGTAGLKVGQASLKSAKALGDVAGVARAEKVIANAAKIAEFPRQLGELAFDAPLRMVGINTASRRQLKDIQRFTKSEGLTEKGARSGELRAHFGAMDDAALKEFHDAALYGTNQFASPAAENLYRYMDGFLKEKEVDVVKRGIRTADELETIKDLKVAANRSLPTDAESLATIRAQRTSQRYQGLYTPSEFTKDPLRLRDIAEGPDVVRTGDVGFLKPYGKGKSLSDPRVWVPKVVDEWIDARTNFRFMDQVLKTPGLVKAVAPGEASLAELVDDGLLKKWLSPTVRAKAVKLAEMRESLGTKDALAQLMRDPVAGKYVPSIERLAAADPTVASYIRWSFKRTMGPLGAFLKVYDRVLGVLKKSFTVFNPSFYTGNLVGDALFLSLAGAYGVSGKVARKIVRSFPPELRKGTPHIASELGVGGRITEPLQNIVQSLDTFAAQGLLTRFQVDGLKNGLVKFQVAGKSVFDTINELNKSPELVARIQESVLRLDEQVAATMPEMGAMSARIGEINQELTTLARPIRNLQARIAQEPARRARVAALQEELGDLSTKRQTMMAQVRQRFHNAQALEAQLPELRRMRDFTNRAINDALSFIGDYNGLGPIEQGLFRRIVPFYSFFKAMSQLAFKMPFIMPERTAAWAKIAQFSLSLTDDPDLPEWMRGYIPAYTTEDGKTVWVSIMNLLPLAATKPGRFMDMEIPRIFAFWQQNPFITIGLRGIGGRDEFFWAGKPEPGKVMVALSDGSVARFRPDGKIETVVPQAGLFDTLLGMIPAVRIMEQITSPYDINRGPKMNADGSYRYPKEFWESLIQGFGVRTKIEEPGAPLAREQGFARSIIRKLQGQVRTADPQTQAEAQELMNMVNQGYYKRIATR